MFGVNVAESDVVDAALFDKGFLISKEMAQSVASVGKVKEMQRRCLEKGGSQEFAEGEFVKRDRVSCSRALGCLALQLRKRSCLLMVI